MSASSERRAARPAAHEERIDLADEGNVLRWAERLCTTPEELRKAVKDAGPEVEAVKRRLFENLLRAQKPSNPT